MTTWAIFYHDGAENTATVVDDPSDFIERYVDVYATYPLLFENKSKREPLINGIIEITSIDQPRIYIDGEAFLVFPRKRITEEGKVETLLLCP